MINESPASPGERAIVSATSHPLSFGMRTSRITRRYGSPAFTARRNSAKASSPPAASAAGIPQPVSVSRTINRFVALSSTIKVRKCRQLLPLSRRNRWGRLKMYGKLGAEAEGAALAEFTIHPQLPAHPFDQTP